MCVSRNCTPVTCGDSNQQPSQVLGMLAGNCSAENCTNSSTSGYDRDEDLARGEIATLAIMFIVTVVGNSCILFALCARRKHRKLTRMYFFILHLSIADLITGFLNVLPQLAWDITYRYVYTH
ncbi:hypothetical protein PR048_024869 [Dryococelus australis]|uniref:G-protein coupled receptors family 1 profile domain-containing protein n=1 Tax=Dryococelus australis TaxID=614101 RepID=A0ABQ9GPV0_9NEOP|nr:hypothetical protein PR048_024869 [Dryococelus australis]